MKKDLPKTSKARKLLIELDAQEFRAFAIYAASKGEMPGPCAESRLKKFCRGLLATKKGKTV